MDRRRPPRGRIQPAARRGNPVFLDLPRVRRLSRQLVRARFASDFDRGQPLRHAAVLEQADVATPHAHRSTARVLVRPASGAPLRLYALVERIGQAPGTPVQAAVKREDAQAFALASGENTMFCEDAPRRIARALDLDQDIDGFRGARASRKPAPHDAVAIVSRNLPDRIGQVLRFFD